MSDDDSVLELEPLEEDPVDAIGAVPLVSPGIEGYVCRYCGKRLGVQVRRHAPGLCCTCAHAIDPHEAPDWYGPHRHKEQARRECPYRGALRGARVTVSGVRVGRPDYTVDYVDAAMASTLASVATRRGHNAVVMYLDAQTLAKDRP